MPNIRTMRRMLRRLISRNSYPGKYDYKELWMRFSKNCSGSLDIRELLPRVGEFVAEAMSVRQVAFWLPFPGTATYHLAYRTDQSRQISDSAPLRLEKSHVKTKSFPVSPNDNSAVDAYFSPVIGREALNFLGIQRIGLVEQSDEVLAIVGIGTQTDGERSSAEDEVFLASVCNQLGQLILTHKLSEELLLAREWDSFNRFVSFILHDLKNLATLQGMTIENSKQFRQNPQFISDAFDTFGQTTEKMINLIASLSVRRGQFSLKQQPVNILEIITNTFENLKLEQRNGLRVRKLFPAPNQLPAVAGDPALLQKAFTNLLLNAIQSLPEGQGAVEVSVSNDTRGKITASIRDTGCGIAPDRLENLFRPFQTTKENGLGIGLCHTRSIVEVHGGEIRIESQLNAGTKVDVDLPTLLVEEKEIRP